MSHNQTTIFVTGATGFVGTHLVNHLAALDYSVRAAVRQPSDAFLPSVESIRDFDLTSPSINGLAGVDCVIHCAARVHVMNDQSDNPLDAFREVNVTGTLNLARQAASSGVKRFIFLSSIKVHGEATKTKPFSPDDSLNPGDPYAISKMEAEKELMMLAQQTKMEVVIIRPPLIYGPGVKANFLAMMRWLDKQIPLPLGLIKNKRSLVATDNLIDFIETCVKHPMAANQCFLVSDNDDVSITDLLKKLSSAMEKRVYLLPIPISILHAVAFLFKKNKHSQRLLGSLQVDISKNQKLLNWTPPMTVEQALEKTVRHFKKYKTISL